MLVSSIGYFKSNKHLNINKNKVASASNTTSEGLGLSQQQYNASVLKSLKMALVNLLSKDNSKKEDSLSLIA